MILSKHRRHTPTTTTSHGTAVLDRPAARTGDCDGSGWIAASTDWPSGDEPAVESCHGCEACDPDETEDCWS